MNKKLLLTATLGMALGLTALPAGATTSGFDFTECTISSNSFGNAQTETSGCGTASYSNTSGSFSQTIGTGSNAITVTATAYTTGTGSGDKSASGTTLYSGTDATVGQYTGNGIGICSIGDTNYSTSDPDGCSSPSHQVDDQNSYEFVLLTFSTPVDLSTISLANYGGGPLSALGFSYWVDPSSLLSIPPDATTVLCGTDGAPACPSSEGNGDNIGSSNGVNGSWITGFGANGQSSLNDVTTLLVGADVNETNDYFKIQGLGDVQAYQGTHQGTTTPEPATFGMLGLALVGFGLYRRKSKRNS